MMMKLAFVLALALFASVPAHADPSSCAWPNCNPNAGFDAIVDITGSADPCKLIQAAIGPSLTGGNCRSIRLTGTATFGQDDTYDLIPGEVSACVVIAPGDTTSANGYPNFSTTNIDLNGTATDECLEITFDQFRLYYDATSPAQTQRVIGWMEGSGYFVGHTSASGIELDGLLNNNYLRKHGQLHIGRTGSAVITNGARTDWVAGRVNALPLDGEEWSLTSFIGYMDSAVMRHANSEGFMLKVTGVDDADDVGVLHLPGWINDRFGWHVRDMGTCVQLYGNTVGTWTGGMIESCGIGLSLGDPLNVSHIPIYNLCAKGTGLGDTGTATGGSSTTLVDTGQAWTTNEWANYYVYVYSGTGAPVYSLISSNTATQLTFASVTTGPASGSLYQIADDNCDAERNTPGDGVIFLGTTIEGNSHGDLFTGAAAIATFRDVHFESGAFSNYPTLIGGGRCSSGSTGGKAYMNCAATADCTSGTCVTPSNVGNYGLFKLVFDSALFEAAYGSATYPSPALGVMTDITSTSGKWSAIRFVNNRFTAQSWGPFLNVQTTTDVPLFFSGNEIATDTNPISFPNPAGRNVYAEETESCVTVNATDAAAEVQDTPVFSTGSDTTLVSATCRCVSGTCTTPGTFTLEDQSANAVTTGAAILCETGATLTKRITTAGALFLAGETIRADITTAPTTTAGVLQLCVRTINSN